MYGIIRRVPNASMRCGTKRWHWAGQRRPSARWIGIWVSRVHGWRDARTSRHWWQMSRWGKWARCLLWRSRVWRARTWTGIGCWSYAHSPIRWLSMAQAELHFFRGRLQGGKLNKAQKGELRFPLPVGLCYDDEGRIVLDPNDEVRGAVQWVFRLFQKTGSAYAVVKRFTQSGLRFPKRAYGGAWAGQLIWGR